jgi:hypothetical protein
MCVTLCILINAEVSEEGPEYNFEVGGRQKITSVKELSKEEVKYIDVWIFQLVRITSYHCTALHFTTLHCTSVHCTTLH